MSIACVVNAIPAVIGLNVEPGQYDCKNLVYNGFDSSLFNCSHCSFVKPKTKSFASNVGVLTSANTSPVCGSNTTKNPLSSFNWLYNFVCKSASIVNFMSFPSCLSCFAISFNLFPSESSI